MTPPGKVTPYHWLMFTICFLGTAFAGTVSTLMSVYLPVAVKDLLGNRDAQQLNDIGAYINAVFLLGGTAGGFACGVAGDHWGRKTSVILSIATYGIATVLTGYMPHWWGVVGCRFFCGFGYGGVLVTTTTLMTDEWPERTRAVFIGILSIAIPVGIFSAGAINYNVAAWRQGFLIGLLPVALAALSVFALRESKAWRSGARPDRAQREQKLFSAPHRRDLIMGSVIFGTMLIGLWAIFSWLPTWLQELINTADAQKERGISMMMLGIGGLTGGFVSGWLVNAAGLKKAMIACFAACFVLSLLLFKTNPVFSPVIYAEIAGLAFFFGASQGVLSVYIPLLFPVSIRSTATGFCFNAGRIFTAAAVLFVGMLVTALGGYGNSLFIFSLVFLIGLAATLFAREQTPAAETEVAAAKS